MKKSSEQPLVSIAMTTYNGEKYLTKQLESIYAQTYKNIEVIICDDCSTDNTINILEEYKRKYGLKYFINSSNLGYIKNFYKAISLTSGDYIALSDQDDIWLLNKIEIQMRNIGNYSLICSDLQLIDDNDNIFEKSFKNYQSIKIPSNNNQLKHLLFSNFVTGCTCLFKKEILNDLTNFPDCIPHDWWLAILASGNL